MGYTTSDMLPFSALLFVFLAVTRLILLLKITEKKTPWKYSGKFISVNSLFHQWPWTRIQHVFLIRVLIQKLNSIAVDQNILIHKYRTGQCCSMKRLVNQEVLLLRYDCHVIYQTACWQDHNLKCYLQQRQSSAKSTRKSSYFGKTEYN